MAKTKIQWADEVWNPVTGCTKVSEGCQNCYAEKMAARLQKILKTAVKYRNGFEVTCHPDELEKPFHGKGKRIFVNSMSDLFHDDVPFSFVDRIMWRIFKNKEHNFMVLTKRPERMYEYFSGLTSNKNGVASRIISYNHQNHAPLMILYRQGKCLQNLEIGVTAENQRTANERIPVLLKIPAAVRFVSVEPMLERIDLTNLNAFGWWMDCLRGITANTISNYCPMEVKLDGVICGGESGAEARPVHPDWVRLLRNQCVACGVPFFFKQWGAWTPIYDRDIDDPDCRRPPKEIPGKTRWLNFAGGHGFHWQRVVMVKKMKKQGMPELDGKVWNQLPGSLTTENTEGYKK